MSNQDARFNGYSNSNDVIIADKRDGITNSDSDFRMDTSNNQSNNNGQNTNVNINKESSHFNFTRTAIDYAISQNIPPTKIVCEPKIKGQNEGGMIIKGLIKSIEKDFKILNPTHNGLVAFDGWYIDYRNDISCITNDIELFVCLCNNKHVPDIIENINISIIKPRNLPPQRSVIIKGVPNSSSLDDMQDEMMKW